MLMLILYWMMVPVEVCCIAYEGIIQQKAFKVARISQRKKLFGRLGRKWKIFEQ
jgi:hypothetical protein